MKEQKKKKQLLPIIICLVVVIAIIGGVVFFTSGNGLNAASKKASFTTSTSNVVKSKYATLSTVANKTKQTANKASIVMATTIKAINTSDLKLDTDSNNVLNSDDLYNFYYQVRSVFRLGDVNLDEKVDSKDYRLILRYAGSLETFNELQKYLADVNKDGKVTTDDSRLVLRNEVKDYTSLYFGDVNFDGKVDSTDSTLVQQFAASLATPTELQKYFADIDKDGKITTSDSRLILRIAQGYDKKPYAYFYYGDTNLDRKITTDDSDLLLKFAASTGTPSLMQKVIGDTNKDGKITTDDSRNVSRMVQNLDSKKFAFTNINKSKEIDNLIKELNLSYCHTTSPSASCTYTTNNSFTDLGVGTHYIKVKNGNGASLVYKLIIKDDADVVFPTISKVTATCPSTKAYATVNITATDNKTLPEKSYSIDGANYSANYLRVYNNKTYTAYVKDSNGNVSTKTVVVDCIDAIDPTISSIKSTLNTNGSVTLSVEGAKDNVGLATKAYSLDNKNFQSSNAFNITKNGTYTLYVSDYTGNRASKSITVSNVKINSNANSNSNDKVAPTYTGYTVSYATDFKSATITIIGAKDNVKLHATPYYLAGTNNGAWQASKSVKVTTNKTHLIHIKDVAGNTITVSVPIVGLK